MRINIDTGIKSGGIKRYDKVRINNIGDDGVKSSNPSLGTYKEIDYSNAAVPSYTDVEAQVAALNDAYVENNVGNSGNIFVKSNETNADIPNYADIEAQTAALAEEYRDKQNSEIPVSNVVKVDIPDYSEVEAQVAALDKEFQDKQNSAYNVETNNIDIPDYGKEVAKLEAMLNDKLNPNNMDNINYTNEAYVPNYEKVEAKIAAQNAEFIDKNVGNITSDNMENKINSLVNKARELRESKDAEYIKKAVAEVKVLYDKMEHTTSHDKYYQYKSDIDKILNDAWYELNKYEIKNYYQNNYKNYENNYKWVSGFAIMAENAPTVDDYIAAGATIASGALSLGKGSIKFFESVGDSAAIGAGYLMSLFTGAYDLGKGAATGKLDWSTTNSMWNNVIRPATEKDDTDNLDKIIGARQALDTYSLLKSDSAYAQMLEDIGYYGTGIILTAATGGAAGVSNAPLFTLGSGGVKMAVKIPAAINAGYALVAGQGRYTSEAWRAGAGTSEGIGYGRRRAALDAASLFIGQGINGFEVAQGAGVVPQLLNSSSHVLLDTAIGAGEALLEPAVEYRSDQQIENIMNSINYNKDGVQINNLKWDELTAWEKYTASFNYHGGWNNVLIRAAESGLMSFVSETPEIISVNRAANIMSDINTNGITKETIGEIQGLKGNSLESLIGQAKEADKFGLIANNLTDKQVREIFSSYSGIELREAMNSLDENQFRTFVQNNNDFFFTGKGRALLEDEDLGRKIMYEQLDDKTRDIVDLFNRNANTFGNDDSLIEKVRLSNLNEENIKKLAPFLENSRDVRDIYNALLLSDLKVTYLESLSSENLVELVDCLDPRGISGLLNNVPSEEIPNLLKKLDDDALIKVLRINKVAQDFVGDECFDKIFNSIRDRGEFFNTYLGADGSVGVDQSMFRSISPDVNIKSGEVIGYIGSDADSFRQFCLSNYHHFQEGEIDDILNGNRLSYKNYLVIADYLRDVKQIDDIYITEMLADSFDITSNAEYMRLQTKLCDFGLSSMEADKVMAMIDYDSIGTCSYANIANVIVDKFKDKPELFKEYFGFDLYTVVDGKKVINSTELYLDMYVNINSNQLGGNLFEFSDAGRTLTVKDFDPDNQLYLQKGGIRDYIVDNYLKSKSNELSFRSDTIQYRAIGDNSLTAYKVVADNSGTYYSNLGDGFSSRGINSDLMVALYNGEEVSISVRPKNIPAKYYNSNGTIGDTLSNGGHVTYIKGITSDGRISVINAGFDSYLNIDELLNDDCVVSISYSQIGGID